MSYCSRLSNLHTSTRVDWIGFVLLFYLLMNDRYIYVEYEYFACISSINTYYKKAITQITNETQKALLNDRINIK